jgi:hypothetical protein
MNVEPKPSSATLSVLQSPCRLPNLEISYTMQTPRSTVNDQQQSKSPGQTPSKQEEYLKKIDQSYEPAAQLVDETATETLTGIDEMSTPITDGIDQANPPLNAESDRQKKLQVITEDQTKRPEQSEKTAVHHWTDEKPAEQQQ